MTTAIRAAAAEDAPITRSDLDAALATLNTRMTRTLYGVAAALLAGQLAAVLALLRLLG